MNNNEFDVDLRIKEGTKVDGIVQIFERENPVVQLINTLKCYTSILIGIAIVYILIELFIQRFTVIGIIATCLFIVLMISSVYIVAGELSYTYTKSIGGKRAKHILKKEEGILGTIAFNFKLMKKEEWKLINKILRVNHLDTPIAIKELKEYYSKIRPREKYEINVFLKNLAGIYLLPIILGIISIYTAIANNIVFEQSITNISYIIIVAIFILVVVLIIYVIHMLKKFSVTNIYTYPKLEKLLLEILLNKERDSGKEKVITKTFDKH